MSRSKARDVFLTALELPVMIYELDTLHIFSQRGSLQELGLVCVSREKHVASESHHLPRDTNLNVLSVEPSKCLEGWWQRESRRLTPKNVRIF